MTRPAIKKVTDLRIASWIKRAAKVVASPNQVTAIDEEFRQMVVECGNAAVSGILAELRGMLKEEVPDADSIKHTEGIFRSLRSQQLVRSAVALWSVLLTAIRALPPIEWLSFAPNADCVETARKAAGIKSQELVTILSHESAPLFATVAADWLLAHATAKETEPLLMLVLRDEARPQGLLSSRELLRGFLSKDPKRKRLLYVLGLIGSDPKRLSNLLLFARQQVLNGFAVLAQDERTASQTHAILYELFLAERTTTVTALRARCGEIAVLAGQLLQVPKLSTQGQAALSELSRVGRQIRLESQGSNLSPGVWTLEQGDASPVPVGKGFDAENAKHWAIVYERAEVDAQPLGYLETLGHNLGLREILTPGAISSFIPRMHEDIDGGLIPGDTVVGVTSGWKLNETPVIRAKVRRKAG